MRAARIAIIGGGLSGLYAALLLEQQGIEDYVLLEARSTFGGRILSVSPAGMDESGQDTSDTFDRFDLGPTWFWPEFQPQFDRLVSSLELERFEQHDVGSMIIERSSNEGPLRVHSGHAASPRSMRLVGGMNALVAALCKKLPQDRLSVGHSVKRVRHSGQQIEVDAEDSRERLITYRVQFVLLAVPPRLATSAIDFTPPLPDSISRAWSNTATWMASHAKYVAVYDRPFWRDRGLSGEARSAVGPLAEVHDASMPGGSAALFGFFGVPAHTRKRVPEQELLLHCRAQFKRMFGAEAEQPKAELIKDWAADPLTATAVDLEGAAGHGAAPQATVTSSPWHGRLVGIASEWSVRFPGYVAGAIDAATIGVREAIRTAAVNGWGVGV
ncbi:Amine oxidase [Paraburkholderia piptadeniae]|uniref:NAD(P)-binding protein n=2 Tax=Paraburkholderia TaxID=1822464 RepID=A0A7X1NFA5_9BURK|nr:MULTISPECIES: FAD-dependent oxidoreductase [Paraburkholderia]MPW20461.1 NAD(P)-binding protein [Paraburkholderia franconis]SIT50888.1 Amine oxidase [Paraburkholderia piptadeniae]